MSKPSPNIHHQILRLFCKIRALLFASYHSHSFTLTNIRSEISKSEIRPFRPEVLQSRALTLNSDNIEAALEVE